MEVKHGSTRTVLIFRNLVVKIPNYTSYYRFLKGMTANQSESNWWCCLHKTRHKTLIAPIYFNFFGLFIVMKRCYPVFQYYNNEDWEKYKSDYRNITTDINDENFGLIDDRLVLIDYA